MDVAWVYILKCSDGSYYTGKTQNLEIRLAAHQQGTFKGYTFKRRPLKLVLVRGSPLFMKRFQQNDRLKGGHGQKKKH